MRSPVSAAGRSGRGTGKLPGARRRPRSGWTHGLVFVLALRGAAAAAGETLPNGIVLPPVWPPPLGELSRSAPAPPPYLLQPPPVIPIDVGRQLFVDDFLIEQTDLQRTHHQARYHPASPVLRPERLTPSRDFVYRAGVFSDGVWYDPKDQLFKAWYHGGEISREPLQFATCYATSRDGIRWRKPRLDVVPGTNIVLPDRDGLRRNSSTVWLDHFESDPARRFKMFRVVQQDMKNPDGRTSHRNFIQHHVSADGIHWQAAGESADCGDRTTVFFNALRQRWVMSLRAWSPAVSRCRAYFEAEDVRALLKFGDARVAGEPPWLWVGADELDPGREDLKLRRVPDRPWDLVPSQLYNLDCNAYESLLVGLFSVWRGQPEDSLRRPKIDEVCVGFSRDGFHWSRPDRRAFYGVSEQPRAWNHANVQSAGGVCLIVGDELYFYGAGTNAEGALDPTYTGLAVLRRDGFASMDAGATEGSLTTRPIRFSGRHLFVNAAAQRGTLRVEVLDEHGRALAPFTAEQCLPVRSDLTKAPVRWKGAADLSALSGRTVRFRFRLKNGSLFAFWVSPDARGASYGYVAAGGPGFSGPRDIPAATK